jgi:hypothetical protein
VARAQASGGWRRATLVPSIEGTSAQAPVRAAYSAREDRPHPARLPRQPVGSARSATDGSVAQCRSRERPVPAARMRVHRPRPGYLLVRPGYSAPHTGRHGCLHDASESGQLLDRHDYLSESSWDAGRPSNTSSQD